VSESPPILHVDLVLLREDVTAEARATLLNDAAGLAAIEGLLAAGLIEAADGSDFDLAFFFALRSLAELEAFGTDARYIRFLQGGVAGAMRSFGGADAQLAAAFDSTGAFAACVGLAATPQTYDWQVREVLERWAAGKPRAACGLAIGERQRYRGIGIMFSNNPVQRPASGFEGFGVDFIAGPCRMLK
jgi:hypothetical protein